MNNELKTFTESIDDTPIELTLANAEAEDEYREACLQSLLAELETSDTEERYARYLSNLGL